VLNRKFTTFNSRTNHSRDVSGNSMKHCLIILLIIFPLTTFSQIKKKIKVVNGITQKKVEGIYCYILQNNDKWIDIGETNKKGIFETELWNLDTTSTYQIDITASGYMPFRQDINPFDNKKLTVAITPDSTFTKKNEKFIYLECSTRSFGSYRPKEPRSIYDLPNSIRIKLETHLTKRLGQDFYSKLSISGGQIVDLDRLYIVEDNAKNYKWTPYSYYLCFSFQDTAKSIGLYTAKIVLDKYGNVVEDIELPNIIDNNEKAKIISLEQAKAIAIENKFYDDKTLISLSYDDKHGSVTWCFKQTTYNTNHTLYGWTWVIDAHNGKVIGKYDHGGIWH